MNSQGQFIINWMNEVQGFLKVDFEEVMVGMMDDDRFNSVSDSDLQNDANVFMLANPGAFWRSEEDE
eukprot:CAMPEP_0202976442 /NCGR_PEP_ID=MMETSP1396-20130829/77373_1 /ASSEMBLY_ACC=CAM_ASM_000872 /TAXON_ID= /ORGANISM="Pseudokeronopsis sp., Strain Brazil" /LENGTH=66 /DNA_ID=CAMNT_0049713741 /DNA_START=46 /DNA_END=246 /DNA_ORIENTATION=-